jgi:hypothetical protein
MARDGSRSPEAQPTGGSAATPSIPGKLYGLRAWKVTTQEGKERLAAVHDGATWPCGEWLEATCGRGAPHAAPDPDCSCGIHAWHPRRSSARRALATRSHVVGVVEATGAVELHEDGFRAQRARPAALMLTPGANVARIRRLAECYAAEVVEIDGADELVAWCRDEGLGLDEPVVDQLLGPAEIVREHRARHRRVRRDAARLVAALLIAAALGVLGMELFSDPPGHDVYGRTGKVEHR